jgi:hypothetical protein
MYEKRVPSAKEVTKYEKRMPYGRGAIAYVREA